MKIKLNRYPGQGTLVSRYPFTFPSSRTRPRLSWQLRLELLQLGMI